MADFANIFAGTTSRHLFTNQQDQRGPAYTARLHDAWTNILRGAGSREDAALAITDLAEVAGVFVAAPEDATPNQLMRREGARDVVLRILFLLDLPQEAITALRKATYEELLTTAKNEVEA